MSTEKNQANAAPIPAPPVTLAVPGPPVPAGAGVAFAPVSAQGKKRMKLIGILVGTYSSIYIVAPLVVYFEEWKDRRAAANPAKA